MCLGFSIGRLFVRLRLMKWRRCFIVRMGVVVFLSITVRFVRNLVLCILVVIVGCVPVVVRIIRISGLDRLRNALFDVPHRHIVMSVPRELWGVMKRFRRRLLKVYMDAAIIAINDTLSYFFRKDVMAGVASVLS
jgi:hypothetical protein